jgi:tetratricopeptide (TPR) repeat protein
MTVIALLIASYPVIRLISWWMDGGAEPILALCAIFLYMALVVLAAGAPRPIAILVLVIIILSSLLLPYFGKVSEQKQNRRIDDEFIESYSRALEENPMNPAARIALAEALHKRGDLDQAIEHLSWTLQQFPKIAIIHRGQLDTWTRERERRSAAPLIFCHMCHAENFSDARFCANCGVTFSSRAAVYEQILREGGPRVVLRGWIVAASLLIFSCFLLLYLPILLSGPIIFASAMVGAWLFLRWVGGDMGTMEP